MFAITSTRVSIGIDNNNMEEYLLQKMRSLSSLFTSQTKVESLPWKVKKNIHLDNVIKILSWDDPFRTWGSFLALNLLFWLTIHFELRLFGILFGFSLILFLYESLFTTFQQDIEHNVSNEVEYFYYIFNSVITTMCIFRKESPAMFCMVMSIFFLTISMVGNHISGVTLAYLLLLALFFLPVGYNKIPLNVKCSIEESLKSLLTSQGIINEDDLMPHMQNKIEYTEDMETLDVERTSESATNSLISGISSMPSFMDAEDYNEILEEDLLPINSYENREITPSIADLSSDSDSEMPEMRFKESHFSRDSSSDEGSKFEEGLYFSEEVDSSGLQKGTNRLVQGVMDYIASASTKGFQLSYFVNDSNSSIQGTKVSRKNSSSDSDFEVINFEDIDK